MVGNPANTNCLIASKSAPSIPKENFSCLTRLDHNRACSQVHTYAHCVSTVFLKCADCSFLFGLQVALRCGVSSDKVKNVIIWGNHSSTQYPDVHHAKVDLHGAETGVYEAVKDEAWLRGDFISVRAHRHCRPLAGHMMRGAV